MTSDASRGNVWRMGGFRSGGGRWRAVWAALAAALACAARAEDWPTYRHDAARSGITGEKLSLPLAECWRFQPRQAPDPAWEAPRSVPVEGILELGRARFDDASHVAVAAGAVCFGTSGDGRIVCLDAATGRVRWHRLADAPVRLAPSLAAGRVYVGADDGMVRCLDAADGRTVWERSVGPRDEKLLGNGRMISRWPVRTGVLVDNGIAYFGAGVFPTEGVYVEAADARDGKLVWRNDTCGEKTESVMSPQGYLLASAGMLYVPQSRVSPAAFDRATGRHSPAATFGKTIGGTSALLAGNTMYTGTEEIMAHRAGGKEKSAWLQGRQLVVRGDIFYVATDKEIAALDRKGYSGASVRRFTLRDQLTAFATEWRDAEKDEAKAARALEESRAALGRAAQGDDRAALERAVEAGVARLEDARRQVELLRERREQLNDAMAQAGSDMAAGEIWRSASVCSDALILAGDVLYAGGDKTVVAVDAATGKQLWSGAVEGRARGLAVSDGRLFVSTTTGAIHCFGAKGAPAAGTVALPAPAPAPADPLAAAHAAAAHAAAAERAVREAGTRRGFCLVLGCETGRLAVEIARRSEMTVLAIDPDAAKVDAARQLADAAGLAGARVCVHRGDLADLPYPDYFANLVVSERVLAGNLEGVAPEELHRVLKPEGGVLLLGQPAEARTPSGGRRPLDAGALRRLFVGEAFKGAVAKDDGGAWMVFRRGALPGAGRWTHEYADAGNTAGGDDTALRCPLGLLWFGEPGPLNMISRHRRAAGPLAANGILLVQGENVVMAYDAYNGVQLWERAMPAVVRDMVSHDCSNLAADDSSFFVATGAECLRLDQKTGRTLATYRVPGSAKDLRWGWVARVDGMLFGSAAVAGTAAVAPAGGTLPATGRSRTCDRIFAFDAATGGLRWEYSGKGIPHPSISVADGRVFLVEDREATSADRRLALSARLEGLSPLEAERLMREAPVRIAVCLNAADGRKIWERPVDLTGGIGGLYWSSLGTMAAKGTLVVFGVYSDGHYWKDFFAGQFETRRVVALDAADGRPLWDRKIGYRVRPLIVGDTLHAEPWAYDLRTGAQRMRTNPVTGLSEPWQFARPGHHCGPPAASQNVMFFRSGYLGYWDLERDMGTMHFAGQRTGCWINFIMACGLAMVPEASSGCMCPFPTVSTVVFHPRKEERVWSKTSLVGGTLPARHLALNLGAPGDRKAPDGTLWLAHPRPTGSLVLAFPVDIATYPGGAAFVESPDFSPVEGTATPWIFTSGYRGLRRCEIPLLGPGDGTALYTVRLAFAEIAGAAPGARVFDIALQEKVVAAKFDAAAGGPGRAVVREFSGVAVDGNLVIDLKSPARNPGPGEAPVLQGVEVIREKMLTAGFTAPSFLLNRAKPEDAAEIALVNHKDAPFNGTLRFVAPEGFRISPAETPVRLDAAGGRATVAVKASCVRDLPAATHPLVVRLVRADGTVELEKPGGIEYLAERGRAVFKAVEDASAGAASPRTPRGNTVSLMVDGGQQTMGDNAHSVTCLKFHVDVPGTPVSAALVIWNAGNESADGGSVHWVAEPWSERTLTYANRPKAGPPVGRIGRVAPRQMLRIPLESPPPARGDVSLAIEPVNCDGVDYVSREGGRPAELHVEYRQ